MRYDVSVIGLYILDVLGRPVTRIPDRGNVDFIEEIRLTVAGTAGGTVVDTAKLGLKSLAVGAVGDDEKADWVLMTMQKHGIDTSAMQRLKGVPTSATILNVRPNGDRPALHVRGASDHFDVPPSLYDQVFDAPIIHLGGTGLLKTLDGPASVTLLKEAKARGRTVTFDLIAASAETIGIVGPLLPYIDYFMPSIEEARDMSGQSTPEDCASFYLDRGAAAASSRWAATAPSMPTRMARASSRPPMRSMSSTPRAAAMPSMRASSRPCTTGWTGKRPCASPRPQPGWSPRGWAPMQASCPSRTRSRK
jgi:sugar/nucleoside kinase (ribokinase family)